MTTTQDQPVSDASIANPVISENTDSPKSDKGGVKFALVNEVRREPHPGLTGLCTLCRSPMVAKCGNVRIWHWAHYGVRNCDPWWENETEWHRNWKGHFPPDWQEVEHRSETGERHRADVKTDRGRVFEFQYSHLDPEERRAREVFYGKMIWIVSGLRRKKDKEQFFKAFESGRPINPQAPIRRITRPDSCTLFGEWAGGSAPVFFDFGPDSALWWLYPRSLDGSLYVGPFPRNQLIEIHRQSVLKALQDFDTFVNELPGFVEQLSAHFQHTRQVPLQSVLRPFSRRHPRL